MQPVIAQQRGAALIVALIILIVITLLSLSAMRAGTLELRMALNQQEGTEAFQTAQAAVDAVVGDVHHFPVVGGAGYTLCTSNLSNCNQYTITLPSAEPFSDSAVVSKVKITRPAPDLGLPPRGLDTSADKYGAATFDIDSEATAGSGWSKMAQGYLILVPKSGQSN